MGELDPLKDFFVEDYEHVAKAYFDQHKRFTDFFKFYLTIMTVPTSVVVYLVKEGKLDLNNLGAAISGIPLAALFFVLAMVGFLMMMTLINIRFEILRHARQVNLIRQFFKDQSGVPEQKVSRYMLFPTTKEYPKFKETTFFGAMRSVVVCMAVINTAVAIPFLWTLTSWLCGQTRYSGSTLLHDVGTFALAMLTLIAQIKTYAWRADAEEKLYKPAAQVGPPHTQPKE